MGKTTCASNFGLWVFFKEIGNSIGTFMDASMSFMESDSMTNLGILVGLDLREGLAKLPIGSSLSGCGMECYPPRPGSIPISDMLSSK